MILKWGAGPAVPAAGGYLSSQTSSIRQPL
jgi:hypothetical protein